jgi:phosphoglucomutase
MTINPVKFGTSGHRGIIGKTFTLAHITAIAYAVAKLLKKVNNSPKVVIGYDPREGNSLTLEAQSFTKCLVDTLINQGVSVLFYTAPVPTPLISKHIVDFNCDGGLILTASHNPPEYNGIKYNPKNGAPAPEAITKQIETIANSVLEKDIPKGDTKGSLLLVRETNWFSKGLISLVSNWFPNTTINTKKVVCDTKYGTCAPIWNELFNEVKLKDYTIEKHAPRSDFGGIEPNPTNTEGLQELMKVVTDSTSDIGISNDPDGDRFSIVDETGTQLIPEEATAIITDYLISKSIPISEIVTTVASSGLIKAVTKHHSIGYKETAVGFKHFATALQQAKKENKLAFGVESSGGLTCSEHTMEKCGFFPGICLLYIMADSGKTLSELKKHCSEKFGQFSFQETAAMFESEKKDEIVQLLQTVESNELASKFTPPIHHLDKTDGLKIVFDNEDWVLIRLSGTEPVARIYAESKNKEAAKSYLNEAKTVLL